MRILLLHNFYGSSAPSGENRVVMDERQLLRSAGHEVAEHFAYSDTIRDRGLLPVIGAGLFVPWNPWTRKEVRALIRRLDPDVMHVHNVFPLLSPSIFGAASGTRTAVVNTLHNYRTVCPAAVPLRNGLACTECIETGSVKPALRYGCYRNSRAATIPLAAGVALHRGLGTYVRDVDAFIALTRFQKSVLVRVRGNPLGAFRSAADERDSDRSGVVEHLEPWKKHIWSRRERLPIGVSPTRSPSTKTSAQGCALMLTVPRGSRSSRFTSPGSMSTDCLAE